MKDIHEALKKIEEATGNEKLEIMRRNPELREIFKAAYDPFKKYHITAPGIKGVGEDEVCNILGHFHKDYSGLLEDLSERRLSGKLAEEILCDMISLLDEPSADLFQKIINKDLRLGVSVKSINKVWPGLIPKSEDGESEIYVQLVKNFDKKKAKFPLLISPKLDGVRGRHQCGVMYSRQGKIINGVGHINNALARSSILLDFDGELTIPGMAFDKASGLIRSDADVPEVVYNIFDAPSYPGDKESRRSVLDSINEFSNLPDCIKIIEQEWTFNYEEMLNIYNNHLSEGYEGSVVYDPESLYKDGRSCDWMRLVPLKTADCKVVGFFEGKKGTKLENSLGGIIVDYKGVQVKVGSGFAEKYYCDLTPNQKTKLADPLLYSNTVRGNIWTSKAKFVGMIAECEFKEETKAGSMRQPRFKGWRYDKTEPNFG